MIRKICEGGAPEGRASRATECSAPIAISTSTCTATAMLYGEPRNATTIKCIDCHGTIDQRPTLITTGNGGQIDC